MKLIAFVFMSLFAPLFSIAAAAESPQEGLQAIIALHEAEDFSTLIKQRYPELDKVTSEAKVAVLIERYTQRAAGTPARLQQTIAQYSRYLEAPVAMAKNPMPRSTETDSVAIFSLNKKETMRLYKQKTGKWGFHL